VTPWILPLVRLSVPREGCLPRSDLFTGFSDCGVISSAGFLDPYYFHAPHSKLVFFVWSGPLSPSSFAPLEKRAGKVSSVALDVHFSLTAECADFPVASFCWWAG